MSSLRNSFADILARNKYKVSHKSIRVKHNLVLPIVYFNSICGAKAKTLIYNIPIHWENKFNFHPNCLKNQYKLTILLIHHLIE